MDGYAPLERGTQRLFVDVSSLVAENLSRLAQKAGTSRNLYVKQLFEAAYSARCAPSGDRALDAAVGARAPLPTPGSGGSAEVERQLAASRATEKGLRAELAAARKLVTDTSGHAGDTASIKCENVDLKGALAAERQRAGRLEADGKAAVAEAGRVSALLAAAVESARENAEKASALTNSLARANETIVDQTAQLTVAQLALARERERIAALSKRQGGSTPVEALPSSDAASSGAGGVLTDVEAKIVRGFAAAGRSVASIASETGFARDAIKACLKNRGGVTA